MERPVVILGVPLPSDSPLFLAVVGVHILLGLGCVVSGAAVFFQRKGTKRHVVWGRLYFFGICGVFASTVVLAILRWPFDNHLAVLGALAFVSSYFGRRARQRLWKNWARLHATLMSLSFIALLTAFYVDNGAYLPFWNQLPVIYLWILPAAFGVPILVYSLLRNPLTRRRLTSD